MGEKKEWKWNLVPTRDTCQAGPWRLPRTGRAAPRPRRGRGRGPGCAAAPQAAPRPRCGWGSRPPPERAIKCSSGTRSRQKQCKQVTDTGLFVRTARKVRRRRPCPPPAAGRRGAPRGLRTAPRASGAPAPRETCPRRGSAAPGAAPPPGSAGSRRCPAPGWWGRW